MKLLIATNNRGKLDEILPLLADLSPALQLLIPADLGLSLEVDETGHTYAENAALKALAFQRASGLVTLADDSGLEVAALGNAPGLHSARYSPQPGASDADRRALLLRNLQPHPRPWSACFHCTVAVAGLGGRVQYAEGQVCGEIIPQERGSGGFGYDAIFHYPPLDKTMAELSMEEKNRLSHRARAVLAARPLLVELAHESREQK